MCYAVFTKSLKPLVWSIPLTIPLRNDEYSITRREVQPTGRWRAELHSLSPALTPRIDQILITRQHYVYLPPALKN
jgi:hypothetical protein